jgi:hypothetical protein
VGWANETAAMSQMYQLLQSKYDDDVASEALKVHGLLMKASSVRSFLAYHNRSPTMMRSIVPQYPETEKFFGNSSNQWHWEVRSWLEMSFLAAKLGLQDSFQGVKKDSDSPGDRFSNTSWICDKVLFLDENSTNVDFVGLMATFSGFLMLWLISLLDRILDLIKRAFRICRKVCRFIGTACQRLWNILFYGLKSAVKWILPVYEFVVRKLREVFPATLSSTRQSRQSDYDDEEIPSGASFRLESLSRNS